MDVIAPPRQKNFFSAPPSPHFIWITHFIFVHSLLHVPPLLIFPCLKLWP